MLTKLSEKMGVEKTFSILSVLFFILNYLIFWQSFTLVLKPDTFVLLFASFIPFLLFNFKEKNKILFYPLLFIVLYIMGIMKQQAAVIFAGLFLYFIFNNLYSIKDKIKLCLTTICSGICVIITVLSIPNCFFFTVLAMCKHPIIPSLGFDLMYKTFGFDTLLILLVFGYLIYQIKNYKNNTKYETLWLFMVIPWVIMYFIGGMKSGGDVGDYQTILVALIPFAVKYLYLTMQNYLNKSDFKIFDNSLVIILFFAFLLVNIQGIYTLSKKYNKVKEINMTKIQYLKNNYKGKRTLYTVNTYMISKDSELELTCDLGSVAQISSLVPEAKEKLRNDIKNKKFDLIYTDQPFEIYSISSKDFKEKYKPDTNAPKLDFMYLYVPYK